MKADLLNREVLAMYDVRGIQNYIFKSNAAKEIIGASVLVSNVIIDGLNQFVKDNIDENQRQLYMTDWQNDSDTAFQENSSVLMQVMFVGGGNAYVLFRSGEICRQVNRFLARYILERTYSLNLAVAVVEKTDNYGDDYDSIQKKMRSIKAHMPSTQPMGALPFMEVDSITGYPLSKVINGKRYSTEAALKRSAFPKQESEQIFDHMVTEKGDNSMLAVCHIDGNSMGMQIRDEMKNCITYDRAIPTMRDISKEIAETFRGVFNGMVNYIEGGSSWVKGDSKYKLYREIIVAGDDITFVCNAKLAIPAVAYFLKHIGGADGKYSACGGIAFFNSHFPFSDAYQVAEACCESAKAKAKEANHRGDGGKIGNYFDFQICSNISAARLDVYRQKHYTSNGTSFLARPYYVTIENDVYGLNKKNTETTLDRLDYWLEFLSSMPRNKAKLLRDAISVGPNQMEETISFLKSRGYAAFFENKNEQNIWYDATEIMDLYIGGIAEDENKN